MIVTPYIVLVKCGLKSPYTLVNPAYDVPKIIQPKQSKTELFFIRSEIFSVDPEHFTVVIILVKTCPELNCRILFHLSVVRMSLRHRQDTFSHLQNQV